MSLRLKILVSSLLGVILPIALALNVSALSPVSIGKYSASTSTGAACSTLTVVDSNNDCSHSGSGFKTVISDAIKIISYIAGLIAVIMIIIGGFKFITSGGEAASVSSAKNTIVYALVGLIIAVLAQLIVHFVIFNATCSTDKSSSNYSSTCHNANG